MAVARRFVRDHFLHDGMLTLRHWRSGWWKWQTTHWVEVDNRSVRSVLYRYTEYAVYISGLKVECWAPNRRKITDLIDALAAICILRADTDQQSWLDDRTTDGVMVAVANGLLDVERKRLAATTPQFFNQSAIPFDYDPMAPMPDRWLTFLGELWPNEPAAIEVLGEWFGYVISGRTDLHKIMLMVGPTRSGKGVIARVLSALAGRKNVAGPTLNSLGGEFGLAPLIGKLLAIISDARFGGKDDSVVVERLLSISGEDLHTVNRKYREPWTGKLPSRLHIVSNELPKLGDASTAIVDRMVLLLLSHSWLGREDQKLEPTLHAQLSGILNWALEGLHRLAVNKSFTRIASADEAVVAMRDLASPVAAFVRDRCEIGADKEVGVDALYNVYRTWAEDNGHVKKSKHTFGRDLRAAVPSVLVTRPRGKDDHGSTEDKEARPRVYAGIGLIVSQKK